MATGYTAFARHRLVCEAVLKSQNISANQSSIRGELFLQSMDAYGAIYASAVGEARVTINGVNQYEKATSGLSANQKKILLSKYYTVGHNAEGNSNPAVSASFYVNVTFAGVYYGTVTVGTFGMGNLPKIPRHSSLNAVPTFTIPSGCSFSISRKSNFTHNLSFWIQNRSGASLGDDNQWTYITGVNNVATSGTFNFSADQMKTIAARLKNFNGSMQGKVKLWTNGVSGLSQQRTVEIRSPESAAPKTSNFSLQEGAEIKIDLNGINGNARFKYDIEMKCAGWTKTWSNIRDSSISFSLSQSEADDIQKGFIGSTTNNGIVVSTPKLDGVQYKNPIQTTFTVSVVPELSSPIVGDSFSIEDTNPKSLAITNSKETILQNVSNMKVSINSDNFSARGFGLLKTVEASFGGITKSVAYQKGLLTFDFGVINNFPVNRLLIVKVTDSRGLTGANTKTINAYPFQFPAIDVIGERKNHFEQEVYISGNIINYQKELPSTFNYKIEKVIFSNPFYEEHSSEINLETYQDTKNNKKIILTKTKTIIPSEQNGDITIKVYDTLGVYSKTFPISKGQPILFINSRKENISVGALTEGIYNSTLPGVIELESERYHTSGKTGIQMNNSDISGVNGIWFSTDTMDNNGKGLHFLRSGSEANVIETSFYDYFYMRDNNFYINSDSNVAFKVDDNGNMIHPAKMLWSGALYMNKEHIVTPTKALSQCRNGWILLWSGYRNGNSTDADWNETYVSKTFQTTANEQLYRTTQVGQDGKLISKLLYINDTRIKGHERNITSQENGNAAVLRRVHEW